jgi:bifunctional non-homologous end joining protein LigD
VRARAGAPVATPITWAELGRPSLHARSFRVDNVFRRLQRRGDAWRGMARRGESLTGARMALRMLLRHEVEA